MDKYEFELPDKSILIKSRSSNQSQVQQSRKIHDLLTKIQPDKHICRIRLWLRIIRNRDLNNNLYHFWKQVMTFSGYKYSVSRRRSRDFYPKEDSTNRTLICRKLTEMVKEKIELEHRDMSILIAFCQIHQQDSNKKS